MRTFLAALLAVALAGCADRSHDMAMSRATKSDAPAAESAPAGKLALAFDSSSSMRETKGEPAEDTRRIIYTGSVELVVEDFLGVEKSLPGLLKEFGGQLAESSRNRTQGEQLSGRWVVRVPASRFDDFLEAVSKLGVPESRNINAQDVSEEYVDLEARLKNKRRLEERMLKLLDEKTGELKDVLTVETELSRVREGIEQIEGRLRFLNDRIALTTLTINVREEKDYVPPEAPSLQNRIAGTFENSVDSLKQLGVNALLAAVALAPWLPLALIAIVPLWRCANGVAREYESMQV